MLFENNTIYLFFKLIITTLGTFGMTAASLRFRRNRAKNYFIFAAYLVCSLILSFLVIHLGGYPLFSWCFLLTSALPGMVMFFLIADVPPTQLVFSVVSHILVSLYIAASVTLFNNYINGNEKSDIALRLAAYTLLILSEVFLLRRPFLRVANTVTNGWGILSLLPCALTILGVAFAQYPENYTESTSSVVRIYCLGIVIIIIYIAIFMYLWTQYKYQMEEWNREILELQIQNIRKNAADTKRKAEMAKIAKQDTYTLMSGIASLAKNGDLKSILDIVDKETAKNSVPASTSYCGDPVLNATLNTYLERAKNSGIALETHVSIPKTLSGDCTEFSICLANALENAIKACEKLPKNNRKMIVKCTGSPKLMFKIENTYKGEIAFSKDGIPKTAATGHGIGTRSIMAFCEKHDALYSFSAENVNPKGIGVFTITVAL